MGKVKTLYSGTGKIPFYAVPVLSTLPDNVYATAVNRLFLFGGVDMDSKNSAFPGFRLYK